MRYSKLLVENCNIFIYYLCLAQGVTPSEFREHLDTHKTRVMGYRVVRKHDNIMFSHFDTIPACDRQTDGRTDVQPIAKTGFSIADARKSCTKSHKMIIVSPTAEGIAPRTDLHQIWFISQM